LSIEDADITECDPRRTIDGVGVMGCERALTVTGTVTGSGSN